MTEAKVAETVKRLIVEQFVVEPEQVTDGATLRDDLGGDDLDVLELQMAVEEELGIETPDDDFDNLQTVGELVTYARNRLRIEGRLA